MRCISLLLIGLCACVESCRCQWSVCEVILVPFAVGVVVTVMRVLLFVWDASMLRECGSARVTAMLVWGRCGFVEYMGGTRVMYCV